jgi:hypothetical protein
VQFAIIAGHFALSTGGQLESQESSMKNKHPLAIFLVLVLVVLLGAAFWVGSSNVVTIHPDGTVEQTYPGWVMKLSAVVFGVCVLVLMSLVFVPFDRTRRALPVWFRARWFVPALFCLYVGIGSAFPFSPHQLTHVLPGFLLGAYDWGVGNIYTYLKLTDWLALFAGCLACARLPGDPLPAARGFAERWRLCLLHLVAAIFPHLLGMDNLLLYPWLLVGFTAVAGLQAVANDPIRRCSRILPWLAAATWIFVPVALQRP